MRKLALILFMLAAVFTSSAGETNYFCIICGKGPLTGQIWLSKWGTVCNDCYKLENHCSLCGLPIRPGDGSVKTGDGRFICKFDLPTVVMDVAGARQAFDDAQRELLDLFGQAFTLKYPEVTVSLFDVDYWSEKGRRDGLHKFGFASTRKTSSGECTHLVVLLSGRYRMELLSTAAHEYTHLWINENCPASRDLDDDTVEAICELSAYKVMGSLAQPEMQKRILENPYTHGIIKTLVDTEEQQGIGYILNWVKNGTTKTFEDVNRAPVAVASPWIVVRSPLPLALKFDGLITIGNKRQAVINGESLAVGEQKSIKLRDKTVMVRCREIHEPDVVLEVEGAPDPIKLKMGEEKILP